MTSEEDRDWEIVSLLGQGLSVYSGIRDELVSLLDKARAVEPEYVNFAQAQFYFYGERCQSINLLLQEGRLWDCEIVMRSALECATRFLFVSVAEPAERSRRIVEYWTDLHEIDVLQQSQKSKPAAQAARGGPHEKLLGGATLPPELENELRGKWSKAKRAALQQKWSFSEMVRVLTSVHHQGLDFRLYDSFLHGYSLSSHMIHADQMAVSLVWDRNHREVAEREAMVSAHSARLITEQVDLLFLCWRAFAQAAGLESKRPELVDALKKLHSAAHPYHQAFAKTQESFYKEWSG